MIKIVVPALFVIEAATIDEAEERAGDMQHAANALSISQHWPESFCFLDETLPSVRVDVQDGHENPHTLIGSIPRLEYKKGKR